MSRMKERFKNAHSDVIVVGAGPSGILAAGFAAYYGASVRIFDRNGFAGKKLAITGKGRCNITNDCDIADFMRNVPTNPKFLCSSLSRFSPQDVCRFFRDIGVETQTERGGRVFPASMRAADVVNALTRWLDSLGVYIEKKLVTGLVLNQGKVAGVRCGASSFFAENVVLACGGVSYPSTGSDGYGFALAEEAGHNVISPLPSLVSMRSSDPFCKEMQGLSLRNVKLSLLAPDGRNKWSDGPGEMIFTHFGVSGPMVLSASAHWKQNDSLSIDLKPGLNEKMLDERILRDFRAFSNKEFQNVLTRLLHKTMIPVIIRMSGIDPLKRAHSISRIERVALSSVIKNFPVSVSGLGPVDEAIVTRGGVSVSEVYPSTMESRLVGGLFFVGEMLDVDAYTGGFNLQIAWSTGFAAGCALNFKQVMRPD